MLGERAGEIAAILDETARPLVDRFSANGNEFQRAMEQVTEQAAERLRREGEVVGREFARRVDESVGVVSQARDQLGDEVNSLMERLTDSSHKLTELIELASESLNNVDRRLVTSTQNFAAGTEKAAQTFSTSARMIDLNVSRVAEISSQTLNEVASIASKFGEHARLLTSASDLLGSAQSSIVSTLDDRQAALENLAVSLVKKSEDIERLMRSFEDYIGDVLERAQGRTKETTDSIRGAISEVVESATKRFSDATQELRQTAEGIRGELRQTRAELQQGVLEMPEEAKQSTTAIRRAVTEQINALKELSEIVARSGRTVDVAEPRPPRTSPAANSRPAETRIA